MSSFSATAIAHPNIALIKYWGNRDHAIRLPSNGSISMTLGDLNTQTTVTFKSSLGSDELTLNGAPTSGSGLSRVSDHLDVIRTLADLSFKAQVVSNSNFPMGAGIASSASGFAALTLSACSAAGLDLAPQELSRISRLGSGSACRSIFGGYVEWSRGENDLDSFAYPLVDREYWMLIDLIAVVEKEHKSTGSSQGHQLADSSPLQVARVEDTERRLHVCREAILGRDFPSLANIAEEDSNMMHAVMMTSSPSLLYWRPATLAIMQSVMNWRSDGLDVFYTIDAGANVHCICSPDVEDEIKDLLIEIPGVQEVIRAPVGGDATLH